MIKNMQLRLNADQRGHISSGRKVNDRPKSIEGFDLSDFPELEAIYGKDPQKLYLMFPVNDLGTVYDDEYSAWGSNANGPTKKRVCDGQECVHRIDETFCGQRFVAGETSECFCTNLPPEDKQRCRYAMVLRTMILHPETKELVSPMVYTFRTHSINSGGSIRLELMKALGITGRLVGHVFELSVRIATSAKRAGSKFPVWSLNALQYAEGLNAIEAGESDEYLQLTSGSDLADDLEVEDEPEPAPPPAKQSKPAETAQPKTDAKAATAGAIPVRDPRDAATVRAAAQAAVADAVKGAAAAPHRARCLAALNVLTHNRAQYQLGIIGYLFGAIELSDLSTAECDWLIDWIKAHKSGDSWSVDAATLKERDAVLIAAKSELPHLFPEATPEATTSREQDPNEPFPDGLNAYGEKVDTQTSMPLGAAKPALDPAMT